MKQVQVQLLLTGDELMSGDIVDSNSAMIAKTLKESGVEVKRKVTVGDDLSQLIAEITHLSSQADILIINGGLGPTSDDKTAQALALSVDKPLAQHQQAYRHIESWCISRGAELSEPNLKQALLPQGCDIIANRIGSAVGFKVTHSGCDIYCTPGVPSELKVMLDEQIMPLLSDIVPEQMKIETSRYQVFGLGESSLQKLIDDNLPDWPESIELGFRAGEPLLEIKLTTRSADARSEKAHWLKKLNQIIGDHLVAEIDQQAKSLAEHVLTLLIDKGKKITTAESCTGGLVASLLTQIAGSSQAFEAGWVTYSNEMKTELLGVDAQILTKHGAVSEETVLAMAKGALKRSDADYVIAVSGVAGPGGGSKEKPVGTVWLAWGEKNQLQAQCLLIPGTRVNFQRYVAAMALDLIRRCLIKSEQQANYLIERVFK